MKKMKKLFALLLAMLMLLSLCACGSGKSSSQSSYDAYEFYDEAPSSAYGAAMSYSADYGYEEEFYAEEAAAADYDTPLGFSSVNAGGSSAQKESAETGETLSEKPDKIIYSSDVTVETTEFDETVGKIAGLVEGCGGWIESSSVSGSNYYQKARGTASTRDASYTLRIPSGRFQEVMDSLSELGNVPYSHIYTENVTSQYYDAQAHLKAYQTQETRLLEMMELAESVEDVIIIEDRLTELRYQIESIQSRLNNWDRRVSYSTMSLTIKEVREYTPEEKVNPTYGEELLKALKDGIKNAGEVFKDLLVFLIELLPVLVILVPVIWLVVWLIRKIVRGTRARRESRADRKEAKKARRQAKKNTEAEGTAAVSPEGNAPVQEAAGHEPGPAAAPAAESPESQVSEQNFDTAGE